MDTPYDWITVTIFAGLVVLFLQRSMSDDVADENNSIFLYILPGLACAVANYLGNHGLAWLAIPILIATVAYIFYWLKPFRPRSPR